MQPFYPARIEDLGQGDFLKVDRVDCRHVAAGISAAARDSIPRLWRGEPMWRWLKINRATDVPDALRAEFEQLGETVVAQIVGRPYTHAAPQTVGVPVWAGDEAARRHAVSWLTEKRSREKRKVWIGWGIGWGLSLIVIGIAVYNLCLTKQADRPELVTTDARLYINHSGNPPPELVAITWGNMGKRSALRGTATLFTISEDGLRHEKFGYSEITSGANSSSTTLTPTFGFGYAQISIDMHKFLGLFLVCVKYHDETNHSYKQKFIFRQGTPFSDHVLTRLDELPSSKYPHATCVG